MWLQMPWDDLRSPRMTSESVPVSLRTSCLSPPRPGGPLPVPPSCPWSRHGTSHCRPPLCQVPKAPPSPATASPPLEQIIFKSPTCRHLRPKRRRPRQAAVSRLTYYGMIVSAWEARVIQKSRTTTIPRLPALPLLSALPLLRMFSVDQAKPSAY